LSVDTATPTGSAGSVGGDRYRLLECVAGDPDGPAVAWRAWDNLLARPVTLTVVRPGGPSAAGFLAHAHAVSTIVHPALARVYDAVDDGPRAYVVSEWVTGTPLTALLQESALDAETAAGTVGRVAEGVAAAHAAGVAFGGVHPDHVVVTPGGTVTLAQVVGDGRAAPADDIRGLGALLYAALTAHWPLAPTGGAAALRPASANGGHLLTPRQVRAGVPEDLSTLAMRALDPGSPHGVRSAAAMAAVLGDRAAPGEDMFPFDSHEHATRPRTRPRWVAVAVPVVAAFAALALVGWLVGSALGRVPGSHRRSANPPAAGPTSGAQRTTSPSTSSAAAHQVAITSATLYDPKGDHAEDRKIDASFDGNASTSWATDDYRRSAQFGNLKPGMGIAYDLGQPVSLRRVKIITDRPGIDVQILAGDTPAARDVSAYHVVGQQSNISSTDTITLQPQGAAQYYIVWITKLVPAASATDSYNASLSEVSFYQ
jgi:eukaryotic-like serine/threonine-protein kinase